MFHFQSLQAVLKEFDGYCFANSQFLAYEVQKLLLLVAEDIAYHAGSIIKNLRCIELLERTLMIGSYYNCRCYCHSPWYSGYKGLNSINIPQQLKWTLSIFLAILGKKATFCPFSFALFQSLTRTHLFFSRVQAYNIPSIYPFFLHFLQKEVKLCFSIKFGVGVLWKNKRAPPAWNLCIRLSEFSLETRSMFIPCVNHLFSIHLSRYLSEAPPTEILSFLYLGDFFMSISKRLIRLRLHV